MNQNEITGIATDGKSKRDALENIRTFSILSITGFVIDGAVFVVVLYYISRLFSSILQPPASSPPIIGFLVAIIAMSMVTTALLLLSFVFLRRGYKILKGISPIFSSPYTGVNLFFIGLSMNLLGGILSVPAEILHIAGAALAIVAIIIVLAGAVLSLIGTILALIMGSFRLKEQFNNSTYGTAGIVFIVGLFVPFLSLAGAILIYTTTNGQLKNDIATRQYV
jgi:hypothetical protein